MNTPFLFIARGVYIQTQAGGRDAGKFLSIAPRHRHDTEERAVPRASLSTVVSYQVEGDLQVPNSHDSKAAGGGGRAASDQRENSRTEAIYYWLSTTGCRTERRAILDAFFTTDCSLYKKKKKASELNHPHCCCVGILGQWVRSRLSIQ